MMHAPPGFLLLFIALPYCALIWALIGLS